MHVFSIYETGIMTASKDFTTCHIGTGRCCKKSSLSFFMSTFLFLRILFIQPVLNSNFSTKFYCFLVVIDLLVSDVRSIYLTNFMILFMMDF